MSFSRILLLPPYWFLAASVLVGAAASRITRRSRSRRPDGRPDSTVKWVLVCAYLTAAVVFATIGLLGPSVRDYLNTPMLLACALTAAAAFPVCRFPRAVGAPVAVLAAASVVLAALLLKSVVAFTGETEIARVKALARTDSRMTLEVAPAGAPPAVVEMDGSYFAPVVRVVIFDDALVFVGSRTWYRFDGLTSFRLERDAAGTRFRQAGTDYYFERPQGISEQLYRLFEQWEGAIPGVKTVQVEMDLKRVESEAAGRPLDTYSIRVQNDGGVQIVRLP